MASAFIFEHDEYNVYFRFVIGQVPYLVMS